ncbi:PP2C family protein-serine/threonine phosphatase [Streptomyces sp. HNM0645]|nr:PP2C family protein-serine/threonine phosphatase [Streptomyces sp. HNM0645]MDI9887417.1 PP2C family protein-serine/threonine phosphatase [Streptomyces sp. HNM0645]
MPFVVVLVALGIELSPAHFLVTGTFLTAMPALAALTMGPKGILLVAALALATDLVSPAYDLAYYSNIVSLLLVSLASVTMSNAMRTRRQSELDQVRRIAVAAQEAILRPVPARLGPVRAASMYLAAEAGAQIGGDLYEAVQTRYGVRLIVGDVRGKGLPAVRAAAAVLGAFRVTACYEDELAEVMNHCAAALRQESAVPGAVDQETLLEGFVTALVAQVSDTPEVQVVNRGHPPPLVLHQGKVQALMPTSPLPPLGLEDLVTGPPLKAESHPFAPGDRLLLYTDGVIEARNPDSNDFFPLPEAMEAVHTCTPHEFLEQLHRGLIRHTAGRLADDAAMLLVDRLNEEAGKHAAGAAGAS